MSAGHPCAPDARRSRGIGPRDTASARQGLRGRGSTRYHSRQNRSGAGAGKTNDTRDGGLMSDKAHIIVIEDDEANRRSLGAGADREGYDVEGVRRGRPGARAPARATATSAWSSPT